MVGSRGWTAVAGLGVLPGAGSITRAGSGHPVGQQCSSFLQRVLLPCHPWGPCPTAAAQQHPSACSSPATHSRAQRLTLTTRPLGAPHFCSTLGWLCTVPPAWGAPRARLPVCAPLPFLPPRLAPACWQAGSTRHPSSLPWGSTLHGGRIGASPGPTRPQEQGQTQVAADPALSLCPPVVPVLYATCYRL